MTKTVLKSKLKKAISEVQDEQLLEGVYKILYSHLHAEDFELTEEEKKELDQRVERHKSGKEKSYTWEEVKARVRKKYKGRK